MHANRERSWDSNCICPYSGRGNVSPWETPGEKVQKTKRIEKTSFPPKALELCNGLNTYYVLKKKQIPNAKLSFWLLMYLGNKDALAQLGQNTAGRVCRIFLEWPQICHIYIQKRKSYLVPSEIRSGLCSLGRAMTSWDSLDSAEALLWSLLYTEMMWPKDYGRLIWKMSTSWYGIKLYTLKLKNKSVC